MIGADFEGRVIEILMVEDNEGDARLAREAVHDCKIRNALHHVWDGEEAMAFLRRGGEYADAPRPDLILLDLNLPRMDGGEVLAEIKEDAELKRIPVVILTTSSLDADILRSYNLHANCFITKPISMVEFLKVVTAIQDFWLTIVTLPAARAAG
jgi:CheY-like chemotaxis protein